MYEFQLRLTDLTVGIRAEYIETMRSCDGYYCEDEHSAFCVRADEEDLEKEMVFFKKRNGNTGSTLPGWKLERSALYRQIAEEMIDRDRILIHGSALSMDGEGYLFIAPSGTGKSTHTALWRKLYGDRVIMVNDDKPLIRMDTDEIVVYGTPWAGKHRLSTNIGVPLKGICRVYRDSTNHIQKLNKKEGMKRLFEQTYRSVRPERVAKTLKMIIRIADEIPIYGLYCNMEPEAAVIAYEAMKEGKIHEIKE